MRYDGLPKITGCLKTRGKIEKIEKYFKRIVQMDQLRCLINRARSLI